VPDGSAETLGDNMRRYSQMLLCGVTAELFDHGPLDCVPENPDIPLGGATTPLGTGVDGSAISVNFRLQFWIIVDAGLSPDFTSE
jgi:hypothetical protein